LVRRHHHPLARKKVVDEGATLHDAIDGQMGHTTRHCTNTTQHDTTGHDTARHDPPFVLCHASTPCRLLGPYMTRDLPSRVVPARRHGQHG
jgi:hypothetical protein